QPQFAAHVVKNAEDSLFWVPIANLPKTFSAKQKKQLTTQYETLIMNDLVPAYKSMSDFIANQYIPNSRE
ncbi:DUF885 domain-containing protein, partial [Pseudoalteromonas agarivorans]